MGAGEGEDGADGAGCFVRGEEDGDGGVVISDGGFALERL